MKYIPFAAAAALLLPTLAFAHTEHAKQGDAAEAGLSVRDAYARSTNPRTGAAFMVIENAGPQDCTLTGARTAAADKVELHTHEEVDGVMTMTEVEGGFPVPAGGSHALERGADHVMLMGLKAPLQQGEVLPLMLDFGDCGALAVEMPVDNERAETAAADGMDHEAAQGEAAASH